MRRLTAGILGLALLLGALVAVAQSIPPPAQAPTTPPPVAPAAPVECEGDPPEAIGCVTYRCTNGIWVPVLKTSGPCSDGDPCHYGKTCTSSGVCTGGGTVVCTGCQYCNSVSTCATKAAGSTCSSVPGLSGGCSCNGTGACRSSSTAGTPTLSAMCWDERGNMTARFVVPPNNTCPVTCP